MAFITAKATIDHYWTTDELEAEVAIKSNILKTMLEKITEENFSSEIEVRGKGMIYGIDCILEDLASAIQHKCFENGLILETCGSDDHVVKLLPALTITENDLRGGLNILEKSVKQVMNQSDFQKRLEDWIVQK